MRIKHANLALSHMYLTLCPSAPRRGAMHPYKTSCAYAVNPASPGTNRLLPGKEMVLPESPKGVCSRPEPPSMQGQTLLAHPPRCAPGRAAQVTSLQL